jgi:hypothetical protein
MYLPRTVLRSGTGLPVYDGPLDKHSLSEIRLIFKNRKYAFLINRISLKVFPSADF